MENYVINGNEVAFDAALGSDDLYSVIRNFPKDVAETIAILDFSHCQELKEFPKVDLERFSNVREILLPENLERLSEGQFENLRNLENINLGNKIEYFPERLFNFCESLTTIEIPDSVRQIDTMCFCNSGLKSVKVPPSVEVIGENSFNCLNLEKLEFSEGLRIIENDAILSYNLKELRIPSTVEKVGHITIENGIIDMSACELIQEIEAYLLAKMVIMPPNTITSKCHFTKKSRIFFGDQIQNLDSNFEYGEVFCFSKNINTFNGMKGYSSTFFFLPESLPRYRKIAEIEGKGPRDMEIKEMPVQYTFFWK